MSAGEAVNDAGSERETGPTPAVSVLLPAYNEAEALEATVERLRDALRGAAIEHEIIVIDDGSSDGTAQTARRAGVRVIQHPQNMGYGRALKTGLRAAQTDWIAISDADGTYPVESLPTLISEIPRFDMVVGARTGPHYRGSLAKSLGRRALEAMVKFVAGVRVPDVNSGLRVFRKTIALENAQSIGNGFSFTTTLTLAMLLQGHFIHYVPIEYRARVGPSKVRFRRDVLRTLQVLVGAICTHNPLKLFLLLAYTALIAAAPCLLLDFALADGTHAAVIVALLISTALGLFALGLVSHILSRLPSL